MAGARRFSPLTPLSVPRPAPSRPASPRFALLTDLWAALGCAICARSVASRALLARHRGPVRRPRPRPSNGSVGNTSHCQSRWRHYSTSGTNSSITNLHARSLPVGIRTRVLRMPCTAALSQERSAGLEGRSKRNTIRRWRSNNTRAGTTDLYRTSSSVRTSPTSSRTEQRTITGHLPGVVFEPTRHVQLTRP